MPPILVPLRRLGAVTIALAAPALAVLIGLAAAATLPWSWALILGAAVAAAQAVMIHQHLATLARLRGQIEDMSRDKPTEPVRGDGMAAELSAALTVLNRRWEARSAEQKSLVATHEAILDSVPDPIMLIDAVRRVTRANAAARNLFGPSLVGREIDAVLRDPAVLESIDEVLGGVPFQAASFTVPGPVERHFNARAARLQSASARGDALVLALYDVTAVRRAEQMRADFVANVSHELRTPLSTLLGFTETLRGPARDDPAARDRFLGIMHEQASRMSRLVRDLLSLSKIEEMEHTPPTGRVSLGPIIASAVDALLLQARARSVAVEVDVAPDLLPVVGDADQLSQVFQNLIDNAIKYSRPKGTVRIRAFVPDQVSTGEPRQVTVAITDEGEGIPREHLARLTERFYRVDAGRSRQMGGTGLGLAIVKHILNRHRGQLKIDSEVGRGSTFAVHLPMAPAASSPEPATVRAHGSRPPSPTVI